MNQIETPPSRSIPPKRVPGIAQSLALSALYGMLPLDDYLVEVYGLDLTDWTLTSVIDMTPNGRVLIGQAVHPEFGQNGAVRITVPEPAAGASGIGAMFTLATGWLLTRSLRSH